MYTRLLLQAVGIFEKYMYRCMLYLFKHVVDNILNMIFVIKDITLNRLYPQTAYGNVTISGLVVQ